jgi:CDP-diglyceride synthetase
MGDFALAVMVSIGDLSAYLMGKILGRTLHLEREKAQEIGQIVVLSLVIGAGIVVTLLYS